MRRLRRSIRNGKPLSEEKLREVMLKIRKGATASLTFAQIASVLAAIGGHAEEFVALAPIGRTDDTAIVYAHDESGYEALSAALRKYLVGEVPSKYKAGSIFLSGVWRRPEDKARGDWYVAFGGVVAVDAMRASLGGKSAEFFPYPGHRDYVADVAQGRKRRVPGAAAYEVTAWLTKETDWVARVNRFLGVEEHVPAEARTRDNTGTCPVCFRNIKLEARSGRELPAMVLHGYERPRYEGLTVGQCDGVNYPPFELSPAGTSHNITILESMVESLRRAAAGAARNLDREIALTQIVSAEREIEAFQRLVKHWRLRPLPREGEIDRNLFFAGQQPDERKSERNGRLARRRSR